LQDVRGAFFYKVQGSTLLTHTRAAARVLGALSDLSDPDKTTFALVAAAK